MEQQYFDKEPFGDAVLRRGVVVLGHHRQAMPTDDAAPLVMRCSTAGWRNGDVPRAVLTRGWLVVNRRPRSLIAARPSQQNCRRYFAVRGVR